MKIIINKSIAALGIKSVVIGIAKNVNPNAKLSDSFLEKQKKMEEWALNCNIDEVFNHPVIQGYKDLLQSVGRSVKKNPPTVTALIRNIQHRGSIPCINSIIDIYNVEALNSFLAIGGHDFDKIHDYIEFTFFFQYFPLKSMLLKQIMSTVIKKEYWHGLMCVTEKTINLMIKRKMRFLLFRVI